MYWKQLQVIQELHGKWRRKCGACQGGGGKELLIPLWNQQLQEVKVQDAYLKGEVIPGIVSYSESPEQRWSNLQQAMEVEMKWEPCTVCHGKGAISIGDP